MKQRSIPRASLKILRATPEVRVMSCMVGAKKNVLSNAVGFNDEATQEVPRRRG
jgi:hypothetical protein